MEKIIIPEGYELKKVDDSTYEVTKKLKLILAEKNLAVTYYNNGDPIPYAKSPKQWEEFSSAGIGCYCWYDNKKENKAKYGALYNWYAVNDVRGLAPKGWKIPTDDEFNTLEKELLLHPICGGYRFYYEGSFSNGGESGNWWSATQAGSENAWGRVLGYNDSGVYRDNWKHRNGYSVRCVKEV